MRKYTKTVIIAEAGINHNGSLEIAKKLIEKAAEANVDYIKFQTFVSNLVATKQAKKAKYQSKNTVKNQSQLEMISKFELNKKDHHVLIKYAKSIGISFLSTAFDLSSLMFLKQLNFDYFKIPSGEITNLPYLRLVGSFNKPIILSTGMSSLSDIDNALAVIEKNGTKRKKITLLHCTTEYPAPFSEINLNVIKTMKKTFGTNVGYSDHTDGIEVPVAAVALGATMIEKHFTLDKNMYGPDHKASLNPTELKLMTQQIRNIESALGDGIKRISPSEFNNKNTARKSLVANGAIKKGEIFSPNNVSAKRPGLGISPMFYDKIMGKTANKDYNHDDFIEL